MSMMDGLRERLRGLFHREEMDQEMDEEFQFHLEAAIRRNIDRGLDPQEARRIALRDFGGIERRKEQTRRERGFRWLTDLVQDTRYALRYFRTHPGFSAVAILVMGLGIGADAAIYSVVHSVLFRSLPIRDPASVVRIYTVNPANDFPEWVPVEDYDVMAGWDDLFVTLTGNCDLIPFTYADESGAETVLAEVHGSALLTDIVGLRPALGRTFLPAEDHPGTDPVVMISWRRWQTHHGGDPDIIGTTIRLNGFAARVVGVGPKGFTGSWLGVVTDYWVPLGAGGLVEPASVANGGRMEDDRLIFARLRPGVTAEQVQARLDALASARAQESPATEADLRFRVYPESEVAIDPMLDKLTGPVAAFLLIIVTLVLLVACSNLAGLLMMRSTVRQREISIRLAVGAGRGRLIRQMLTESMVLGLLGGILGLLLAIVVTRTIVGYKPPLPVPVAVDLRVDGMVLVYTLVVSMMTGLIFGLLPALRASHPKVSDGLRGTARPAPGRARRFGVRNALIVFQVAISTVLLVGAALFLRSIGAGRTADPGFRMDGLAYVLTDVAQAGYRDEASGRAFYERLSERAAGLPGVEGVALASHTPLSLWGLSSARIRAAETTVEREAQMATAEYISISADYFSVLGVGLLAGRAFSDDTDTADGPRTAIVNRRLAEDVWGTLDVVGRTFLTGIAEDGNRYQVVGVVPDIKERLIVEDEAPMFYLPATQRYRSDEVLLARTSGSPEALREGLRSILVELDRDVPVYEAHTLPEQMELQLYIPRTVSALFTVLGGLALLLAAVGLYGIVSFAVAQRRREIGIRVALGAEPGRMVRTLMREGSGLAVTGLIVGLLIAALAMRVLARLLFGISTLDPVSYLSVGLVLLGATTLAVWLPARRSVRLDPAQTLRNE